MTDHTPGCVLDHDPDETECWTLDELRDEAALARAEEMADDLGGWKYVR